MDRIRKEFIKGTAHARCFGGKAREGRLRRCGPVQRRDSRRMMRMDLPGRRTLMLSERKICSSGP